MLIEINGVIDQPPDDETLDAYIDQLWEELEVGYGMRELGIWTQWGVFSNGLRERLREIIDSPDFYERNDTHLRLRELLDG
jgi:hypothetical protein